jgi:deazaflavin-dependent oxidoreductase (nitroreductase family)
MIETINKHEKQTRQFFKLLNKFMLLMWRLGLGAFLQNPYGGYITVLITRGHKSGLMRKAPINYDRDGDTVYVMPGFGERTHWYRNLVAEPKCQLWLPDGWWEAVAEEVTDDEERLAALRRVLIRAGFATTLIEGVNPAQLTDEEIKAFGERYPKLMRIKLLERRGGKGTPGDLAWVWPVLMMIGWVFRRIPGGRKKRQ